MHRAVLDLGRRTAGDPRGADAPAATYAIDDVTAANPGTATGSSG